MSIPSHKLVRAAATTLVASALVLSVILPSFSRTPTNRLPVAGRPYFWAGLNYPWRTYQDFGTGAWGHSGVSHPTTYAEVETDFANMAAQGVRVVKWRLFNDGRYSPEFDDRGYVTGLDEKFFADVDAALEIADRYDINLVFTFFSSGLWTTACETEGVRFGGHADALTNAGKRRSIIEKAVIPLLRHVGRNPRVLAYEIIAEPEWGVAELNDDDHRIKVPLEAVRAFVRDAAQVVHILTGALATVESNRSRHISQWRGLGLDFYTFSWYDWLEPYDSLDQPSSAHGVDRPVVIGEFPLADSKYYDLPQVLDIAYRQGYAGAFGWSYWGGDSYGKFNATSERYIEWVRGHWEEVDVGRLAREIPEVGAPLLLLPYTASVSQMAGAQDGAGVEMEVEVQVREAGDYQLQFFIQEIGNRASERMQEYQASFDENGRQLFRISFSSLEDARPYKLNVAVFDNTWNLRKWFDGLALVRLENGVLSPPDLSVQAIEDPCYQRSP